MKHKHNNWFWGVFFVLAAVFVVVSQVTTFAQIGFWSILAAVLLVAVFIQSLVHLNYFGIFLSLAVAYWIFMQPLHLAYNLPLISPWLLLLAAVLLSIGFYTMFQRREKDKYYKRNNVDGCDYRAVEDIDDNNPYVKVSFGSSSKYLHGDCLKTGQFYCNCGSLEVYFDQVQLDPNGAEVFVDCSLGEISLYIPRDWRVVDKLHSSLGSVRNDSRRPAPDGNAPVLTLTGNISLGAVEIQYI
jgi:predicted membrane protein